MANKYDLKTWAKVGLKASTSDCGTNIGSTAVADGKTRFLTYIRVSRKEVASKNKLMAIAIGEVTATKPSYASVVAATNLKLPIFFASVGAGVGVADDKFQEISGSIEHPILSVSGGKYMGIAASLTAAKLADVFAVYYDE